MNETRLIEIIKDITKSRHIGDDCAVLPDLGITVTQDSLVEGVHFNLDWMSPYQLGVKAMKVNISDILASGAEPAYALVSVSLPNSFDDTFIGEFYKGLCEGADLTTSKLKPVEIIGGDLTGGEKVFISICLIGKVYDRHVSSRSNACTGYKVVTCGEYGSSAAGFRLLQAGKQEPAELIDAHFSPSLYPEFALAISQRTDVPYAMMDTSDGLADALFKIAKSSGVSLSIDFQQIPYNKKIEMFEDWESLVLFGGEDYSLVAVLPPAYIPPNAYIIGDVIDNIGSPLIIKKYREVIKYSSIDEFTFNHFL